MGLSLLSLSLASCAYTYVHKIYFGPTGLWAGHKTPNSLLGWAVTPGSDVPPHLSAGGVTPRDRDGSPVDDDGSLAAPARPRPRGPRMVEPFSFPFGAGTTDCRARAAAPPGREIDVFQ